MADKPPPHNIGTLGERSLHAALKTRLAQPGDQIEARLDGFVIDILRGDVLIEIQTRNFSQIKRKMLALTESRVAHLVHPIAREKWIVRLAADGRQVKRRKSPKRGQVADIFRELVSFPALIASPNFSLEVLLIQQEEVLQNDGQGSWRRKGWSVIDQRLLDVLARHVFESPADFLALLPPDLPQPFTNQDLAGTLKLPIRLAQQMTYCLRHMDVIQVVGKRGRALLYAVGSA